MQYALNFCVSPVKAFARSSGASLLRFCSTVQAVHIWQFVSSYFKLRTPHQAILVSVSIGRRHVSNLQTHPRGPCRTRTLTPHYANTLSSNEHWYVSRKRPTWIALHELHPQGRRRRQHVA